MSNRRALKSMYDASPSFLTFVVFGIITIVIGVIIVSTVGGYTKTSHVTTTVVDKDRVCTYNGSDRSCKYLIFTDNGTYELTDSLLAMRWSSSDAYGRIQRCHTYDLQTRGYRLPFFSMYPNIEKFDDIGIDETCEP